MTSPPDAWRRWKPWVPDAAAGLAVLVVGLWENDHDLTRTSTWGPVLVVLGLAVAVALTRAAPGPALAVAWAVGAVHLVTGTGPLVIEVMLAYVAFGCARWGSTTVVWLSGLSIPFGATIAVLWLDQSVFYQALDVAGVKVLARTAYPGGNGWRLPAGLLGTAILMAPWLLGLALRFSDRSRVSRRSQVVAEAERDQAAEIARLRDEQTRLAHDVHDVVGHSLAVILAQAESAQFRDDHDTVALKQTMANIATSARTSLEDVRQVLAATSGTAVATARQADIESLIEGVRASGHEVESTLVGMPQPMPPELEVVAFRVLQEMLTNAIKHGRRDLPVQVERHWEGDLRIEVRNALSAGPDETQPIAPAPSSPGGGQGVAGMRRRLEAVGGRLDVRRRSDPPTFTATAWVPVRTPR
ncbi:sensor histidine kinase [Nocardioides cynanchi]|uniref:sensor histidine kinase n=1 Tax=Nocardioides cynanchi TaxID=2558918 RepID=UPI0012478A68|nr:histidine kinase [Nocardioides cynanchi]